MRSLTRCRALAFAFAAAALAALADTNLPPQPADTNAPPAAADSAAATNGTAFAFAAGHFAFRMPFYWTMVPDDKLQGYKDGLRKLYPKYAMPNYVLGIQRKSLFTFSLPYALVEIDNQPMPNAKQVAITHQQFADTIIRAYVSLHRSGQFGEVKPMPAIYDTNQHVIVGYWNMVRASDNQRLSCVSAIFPCQYGYLKIHFFMDAKAQDDYMQTVMDVIGSVRFDQGFEYKPEYAPSESEKKLHRMRNMAITLVGVVLLWLVVRIMARKMSGSGTKPRQPYVRRT